MQELFFKADIDLNGKLEKIHNKNSFDFCLKQYAGKSVRIGVSMWRKKRSTKQNSVLHWYVTEIAQETGMPMEDIKSALKAKFLMTPLMDKEGEVLVDVETGEVMRRVKSTTELTTIEFNEFTENIRIWAQEFLNVYLPLPNETVELKFEE